MSEAGKLPNGQIRIINLGQWPLGNLSINWCIHLICWAGWKLHWKVLGNYVTGEDVNDHSFIPGTCDVMHQEEVVSLTESHSLRRQLVLVLHPHFVPASLQRQFLSLLCFPCYFQWFSTQDQELSKVSATHGTCISLPFFSNEHPRDTLKANTGTQDFSLECSSWQGILQEHQQANEDILQELIQCKLHLLDIHYATIWCTVERKNDNGFCVNFPLKGCCFSP